MDIPASLRITSLGEVQPESLPAIKQKVVGVSDSDTLKGKTKVRVFFNN